jgi:hypothetical protein
MAALGHHVAHMHILPNRELLRLAGPFTKRSNRFGEVATIFELQNEKLDMMCRMDDINIDMRRTECGAGSSYSEHSEKRRSSRRKKMPKV